VIKVSLIIITIIFHFWVNNKVVETCTVNLYSKCDPDDFQKVDVLSYSIRYSYLLYIQNKVNNFTPIQNRRYIEGECKHSADTLCNKAIEKTAWWEFSESVLFSRYYYDIQIKEDMTIGISSTQGDNKKYTQNYSLKSWREEITWETYIFFFMNTNK
jgi:hypothetical protein